MTLREVLRLPAFRRVRVVAGHSGLNRPVQWVHVVDIPEVVQWVRPGQLLLTTAYAWPKCDAKLRQLIRQLADVGLAGVGIAVPRFVQRVPNAVIQEADAAGLPVLEIPWDIPFAEITETVHRAIVSDQFQQLQRLEAIHRTLTRAALEAPDLWNIVRTIADLVGRPTCVTDCEGEPLATWGHGLSEQARANIRPCPAPKSDADATAASAHASCWRKRLEALKADGTLASVLKSDRPVYIGNLPDDQQGGCLVFSIRVAGELLGFLWVDQGPEEPDELEARAVEHAGTVVALYLAHQRQMHLVESRLRFSFLDALLEGSWQPTPSSLERARILGYDPQASYVTCILVMLDESIPLSGEPAFLRREQLADRVRRELERLSLAPLLTLSLNRVIFLLPDESLVEPLWARIGGPTVALGVGQAYRGPQGVRTSYLEATKALSHGGSPGIYRFSDLVLPRALMGDREAAAAFVERTLGELRRVRGSDMLLATLRGLASHGFRLAPAARSLHLHPNTLRYRVRCIEQLLGARLADPDVQFRVRLALELLEVMHKEQSRVL